MDEKTLIGITGSIGTGKSTFSRMLAGELGVYVDTDELSKSLMEKGEPGYEPVRAEFGEKILDEEGRIDFEKLGDIVFDDPDKLEQLESILHPLVLDKVANRFPNLDSPVIVVEVPLLFESGAEDLFDVTVAVSAPLEEVEERMAERSYTPEEVQKRRDQQLSQEEKNDKADFIIRNDGTLNDLQRKAEKLRNKILENANLKDEVK